MARPIKNTVDYFSHDVRHGKTIFILESKFGNDGYAFWFKLLELLGSTDNHVYNYNKSHDWEFLLAITKVDEEKAFNILKTLADVGAIDKELWQEKKIWSDNFVYRLGDVYKRRSSSLPQKPCLCQHKPTTPIVLNDINTQSKVKESIVKEIIIKERESKAPSIKKEKDPLEFSFTDKCWYGLDDWRIKMFQGKYPNLVINFLLEDVYKTKFLGDPLRYQKEIAIAGGIEKLVWMWLGQDEKYRKRKDVSHSLDR